MSKFNRGRRVMIEYVDADTNQVIAHSNLRVDRIPDRFELQPRMKIGEEDWVVVGSEPSKAEEVRESGQLRLTLRKVVDLTTEDLVFDHPTLCHQVPRLSSVRRAGSVLEIPEDDWRQAEFVSLKHQEGLDACLEKVAQILAEERSTEGWRDMHVRDEVPEPLIPKSLSLKWVRERFFELFSYDGLTFPRLQVLIDGGFAFQTASQIQLYGVAREGAVETLALSGWGDGDHLERDVRGFVQIAHTHELVLVDWCRGRLVLPRQLSAYFAHRS